MNETLDQKRTRRRWINLAELVAVCGLLIGALTLWLNWSDRRDAAAEKAATAAAAVKERGRLELAGVPADSGALLRLSDARHDLTDVTIAFPSVLNVPVQRPTGDPVIERGPFREALLKATDGGKDDRSGRLPVLITAAYVDGDAQRSARGIYDIIWRTEGRLLSGRSLDLTGLRLRQRGGDQAALDAAWAREEP